MAHFWETSFLDKGRGYVISPCIIFFLFILIIFYWFPSDNMDNFKRTLKKFSKNLLERFDEKLTKVIPIYVVTSLVLIIPAQKTTNDLKIENGTCKKLLGIHFHNRLIFIYYYHYYYYYYYYYYELLLLSLLSIDLYVFFFIILLFYH